MNILVGILNLCSNCEGIKFLCLFDYVDEMLQFVEKMN